MSDIYDEMNSYRITCREARSEADKLQVENAKLKKALWNYGAHYDDCESHSYGPETCTCGLDKALKEKP